MKRSLITVAFALGLATTAYAQDPVAHPEAAERERSPEGGAGFPAADTREVEAQHGIENWWSWDYGPNAKDPAHKDWPPPFGFALLNFALFFGVMWKLAAKPLRTFVAERHDRIAKDLDEAARLRKAAEDQLKEYQRKVANVDAEVDALLKQIRAEAETEKARIIASAEQQAQALKREAEKQIQVEIERARGELRRAVVESATQAAAEMVKSQIGADDQRRMSERYVTEIEQQAKAGRVA